MKEENKLPRLIEWSNHADQAYFSILEKLLENGFYRFAQRIDDHTVECLEVILKYPEAYPLLEEYNVHRAVIHKDYILTYQILEDRIEIVDFVFASSNHPY